MPVRMYSFTEIPHPRGVCAERQNFSFALASGRATPNTIRGRTGEIVLEVTIW